MLSVKLPFAMYDFAYWLKPNGGKLVVTKIIVTGYDVRVDKDLNPILVINFKTIMNDTIHKYLMSDVIIRSSELAAIQAIDKVNRNILPYPINRQEYGGE
jgi:hypothetical protein